MKKFLSIVIVLCAAVVSAAEIEVPVLYKPNFKKKTSPHQLEAVGFADTPKFYVFAFQIKDLAGFLEAPKATMSIYANSDNELETGRFPGSRGWDVQLNVWFSRNSISVSTWNAANESTSLKGAKGRIVPMKETLFILLEKKTVPEISFAPVFQLRVNHGNPAELSLENNTDMDIQKPVGKFADKLVLE